MAIPTNSHINDLMLSYYGNRVDNGRISPLQPFVKFAENLVTLGQSATIEFPNPETTQAYFCIFHCIGAISAGTVTLETAHNAGFTGNWHTIVNRAMSPAQTESTLRLFSTSSTSGPLLNLRARVSEAIVGGTVDVYVGGVYYTHNDIFGG